MLRVALGYPRRRKTRDGVLSGGGRGMRSGHVHCACDVNSAYEDDYFCEMTQNNAGCEARAPLEPHAKKCLRVRHVRRAVYCSQIQTERNSRQQSKKYLTSTDSNSEAFTLRSLHQSFPCARQAWVIIFRALSLVL